jgi:hypothetical protein
MAPTEMVEKAVECAREGDERGARAWLLEARRHVSFARIHELVNKLACDIIDYFARIDRALCRPLGPSGRRLGLHLPIAASAA